MISVWTAWLKAHYTHEFFASLLTISADKKDTKKQPKNNAYMEELSQWDLSVLPPDIRRSRSEWYGDRVSNGIRYGLASITGVSKADMPMIELVRNRVALDQSLSSPEGYLLAFLDEMGEVTKENKEMKRLNKTKMTNLIKAGAFDFGEDPMNRLSLLRLLGNYLRVDMLLPERMTKAIIFEWERDMMGRTVSMRSRWELLEDDAQTQFTGELVEVREFTSQKGNTMARGVIKNNTDEISFLIFPDPWNEWKEVYTEGTRWTLHGKKDKNTIISGRVTPSSEEVMTENLLRKSPSTQDEGKRFMDQPLMLEL